MTNTDFIIAKKKKGPADYTVSLVSLGCDKNRVDSEIMLGILGDKYRISDDESSADIIIVNTCGFIEAAKEESIESILEMARYKEEGQCQLLMATGCLTQRYGEELLKEIPELDVILGVNSYEKLDEYVEKFIKDRQRILDTSWDETSINSGRRILTTGLGATAYLRIGEGCDNNCTYCIIPKIRGPHRSRPMESILKEAELLASQGVAEIILVAQDSTVYGTDLYGEKMLHKLLQELDKIEGLRWIRVLYMYPEGIYPELLETIAQGKRVLPYFDIPIQHISNSVLKRMARKTNRQNVEEVISAIRAKMPKATIRTTLITGFPKESEEEFEELKSWLAQSRLDKVGAFTYSREEGTPAYHMEGQIPEEIKEDRRGELMMVQQEVSLEKNRERVGRLYDVLVEGVDERGYYGRSVEMAPEIDGNIIIRTTKELIAGSFVTVKITEAEEYDLVGELHHESSK